MKFLQIYIFNLPYEHYHNGVNPHQFRSKQIDPLRALIINRLKWSNNIGRGWSRPPFFPGIDLHSSLEINIYPIPNDGQFNVSITTASAETFSISIYNTIGVNIYQETNIKETSSLQKVIDLRPLPSGVYTVIFKNSQNQVVKKIIVNK